MQETAWNDIRQRSALGWALLTMALAFLTLVLLRTAWLCDDAYISFRTVDNFVNGYGLTWNVTERVQAYTHPLWMFLIAAVYFFTGEIFLTAIFVSVVVSTLAVAIMIYAPGRSTMLALLAILILMFSRAFVDYSTSGLENPLSHLLLAVFLLLSFRDTQNHRTLFWMALIASLAALNRMDLILLYLPALAWALFRRRSWRATAAVLGGFLPFVAWELFSVVYYGFPFPNTAYAKLGTGIESNEMLVQGLHYFSHTWQRDPLTLVAIVCALLTPALVRDGRQAALAAGLALYLLYIVKIGGDFMGGRFFATPLFLSVALMSRIPIKRHPLYWTPVLVAAVALSLTKPHAPPLTSHDFGVNRRDFKDENGIGDERMFYFQESSLALWQPGKEMPTSRFANEGRAYRRMDQPLTRVHGSVGYRGYFAGPKAFIIDYYALADPLLARMPARYSNAWRIGHFTRLVPKGYEETANTNQNTIDDKNLAQFYDRLKNITRGPLWRRDRWRDILLMNLGRYDHLIDNDRYRFPNLRQARIEIISAPKEPGTTWNAPGNLILSMAGVNIDMGGTRQASQLEISLDNNDKYQLLFMHNHQVMAKMNIEAERIPGKGGLQVYTVDIPPAAKKGFDALRIFPYRGDNKYSLGHVRLIP
jgi:arabinofuranosyltransferase